MAFENSLCGHTEAQPKEQPEVLLLLLARTCIFMHTTALPHVMETLAGSFPGQGGVPRAAASPRPSWPAKSASEAHRPHLSPSTPMEPISLRQ